MLAPAEDLQGVGWGFGYATGEGSGRAGVGAASRGVGAGPQPLLASAPREPEGTRLFGWTEMLLQTDLRANF